MKIGFPLLVLAALAAAQPNWSDRAKPIAEQIGHLREVPDEQRGAVTRRLAIEIRSLSPNEKFALASNLANFATEGDFGRDTLQEVADTLAQAFRERAFPPRGDDYLTLAQLQKYEHVNVSLDDPLYKAALARLDEDDAIRQTADFTLPDVQGKLWRLRDLRGKIVMVNFWATWCPPCRKEMPDLDRFTQQFPELVILGISDESPEKVKAYLAQKPVSYPILIDTGRKVNTLFRVAGIPKTFIYDREGRLAAEAIDMRTAGQFRELLAQAGLEPRP